jgi:hypothetical protein
LLLGFWSFINNEATYDEEQIDACLPDGDWRGKSIVDEGRAQGARPAIGSRWSSAE